MKRLLFLILLFPLTLLAATNSTPILRGLLQSDLNGGGYNITNANAVRATTFYGDGSQLTGISGGGGSATNVLGTTLLTNNAANLTNIPASKLTGTVPDANLNAVGSAGTYTKVTTDAKGRVTSGTTLSLSDIPSGLVLQASGTGTSNSFTSPTNIGLMTVVSNSTSSGILFPPHTHIYMGGSVAGSVLDLFLNPEHSINQEVQFTSQGRIAILTGYDQRHLSALQMSSGTFSGNQGDASPTYWNSDYDPSSVSDLGGMGYSHQLYWQFGYYNGGLQQGSLGFRVHAIDTNGTAALTFYNQTVVNPLGATLPGTVAGLEIFGNGTNGNGIAVHGRNTRDVIQSQPATTNYGVSWDAAQESQIDLTNNINFTNIPVIWGRGTNSDYRIIDVATGFSNYTAAFPSSWNWYSPMIPTNLYPLSMYQIKVERISILGVATNYFAKCDVFPYTGTYTDPTAAAYISAAGITNASQLTAINTFCVNAKANGYFNNLIAFYPFLGGTSNSTKIDLLGKFNGVWHGSVTIDTNGVTSDGSTGYLDTGIIGKNVFSSVNSGMIGVYVRNSSGLGSTSWFAGAQENSPNSWFGLGNINNAVFMYSAANAFAVNGPNGISGSTNFQGFAAGNLTSSSSLQTYVNGAVTGGTSYTPSTLLQTKSIYVLCANNVGTAASFTPATLNVAVVAQNMTSGNMTSLIADVNALNATLSRK